MITSLRTAVRESLILKAFIGLMMVSFGIWGIGDFIGTGALDPSIAIKVGPTEISTNEFQRRFDREFTRFQQEVGEDAARSDVLKRSIANAVIQDVTRTATVSAAAQDLNIIIPLKRLQSDILNEEAFKNATGTFDQSRFSDVLYQNGLTESQFLNILASELKTSAIIQSVATNARVPQYLVNNLFTYNSETRLADTLLITSPALTSEDLPTDEELNALYQQNINSYTAPEYRKVTALVIEADNFRAADVTSEADLKTRYEENIARYRTPGMRRISQIIFTTQEQAAAARAQAEADDTLETLAAKAAAPSPVDMGELPSSAPVARLMGDAYNLPVGEISQPVETDIGWHLFQVTAETPEVVKPFEEVKDEILEAMQQEHGMDAVYEASVAVEDGIAGGTPLKEIAEYVGGNIVEIAAMDRNGKDPTGIDVPGIFDRRNFIEAAFSTPEGSEILQLLDTPSRNGYYVVHVDAVTPPTPKSLVDVRREVVTLWEKQTKAAKAQKVADALLSEIGPSTQLSDLKADGANVSYAPLGPMTRFGEGLEVGHILDSARISPAFLEKLFSAKVNDVVSAPVADGIVIARLKEIIVPKPEGQLLASQTELKETVESAMREDLANQIVEAFAERYPVEINNEVVDQTIALR